MKKLLLIISIFFCSCVSSNPPTQVDAEVVRVTLPNGCYSDYVKFTYKGHEYLVNCRNNWIYHLKSCPCYKSQIH